MNWKQSGIATVVAVLALVMSNGLAYADDINPGVFAINSQPSGMTYGQWSERWWQWAFSQTTFNNCPNESGPVWFLAAPTQRKCIIPANTAIMFPTFNAEWSVV